KPHGSNIWWTAGPGAAKAYGRSSGTAVGPTGSVTAWEPSPYTFGVLQEHIRANGVEAVCRAEQAAVGSTDGGTVRFRTDTVGTATNRITATPAADDTVEVPVGTLDGWLARLPRPPHLVKMDIEGAEVLALRGAAGLLGRGGPRPIVLLSAHPMFLPEFGHAPADITAEVERHGYVSLRLDGTPAPPEHFLEYLLVPAERQEWAKSALAAVAPG
ncbi:MAG: FkbM family methyltransferase, partial [Gemmataceae bacterium]